MPAVQRMHADQVDIDDALVRTLVNEQFPHWADLPLTRVDSSGTVNAIYRLGDELSVRLPLTPGSIGDVEMEMHWLPRLAPVLPLAAPEPVAVGEPAAGYPFPWSVHRWIDGTPTTLDTLTDPVRAAENLAAFVTALQKIDPGEGPVNPMSPLASRDPSVRQAIAALDGILDTEAVTRAWQDALDAPAWDGVPVLMHADLLPGNLLAVDGELTAVIDFGGLSSGDPAAETIAAWTVFDGDSREAFRGGLGVDDATWRRGRGFALSKGLIALPYYRTTNPGFAAVARHMIDAVLTDVGART